MRRLTTALALSLALLAAACSKPPPPEGSTRTTITTPSGIELEAIELGDGPKVAILSHGATGTKEDFYPIAEAFAADGWRVIAYDGPGVGASSTARIARRPSRPSSTTPGRRVPRPWC